MRLAILWIGIAAFVWIGLHPPMTDTIWGYAGPMRFRAHIDQHINTPTEYRVDTGALLGRLAVIVALTGGLLWTEPQVTPWLRGKQRAILSVATIGLLLLGLAAAALLPPWGLLR